MHIDSSSFLSWVVLAIFFSLAGKIVFTAPSRPLVVQQIEACHNVMGIPQVTVFYLLCLSLICCTSPCHQVLNRSLAIER
jgi:hypothetical protein